ncbi:MAG: hypothetical protein Q4B26_14720 [Eubacteriales bacterium]|nr:hypothetical protein [Eubacteriales bacterium]
MMNENNIVNVNDRMVTMEKENPVTNSGTAASVLQKKKTMASDLDRIRGSLIGGAVGDALGYTVEETE